MLPIHFVVAAWGEPYVSLLLDVLLPCLMAPGNLPALREGRKGFLVVHSSVEDRPRIEHAPAFRAVQRLLPAWCETLDTSMPEGNRHAPCSRAHARAIREAYHQRAALVILPPDLLISNGVVASLQSVVDSGAQAVHALGVRLSLGALDDLFSEKRDRQIKGSLDIVPRELVDLALRHLHPVNSLHLWRESPRLEPSILLWPAEQGLLARCFHLHPLLIAPQRMPDGFDGTCDADFSLKTVPDFGRHTVLADSDAGCMFGLDGPDKTYPAHVDHGDVEGVRSWASGQNCNPLHRWLIRHEIRLHAGDIERTVAAQRWQAVSQEAAHVVDEILAERAESAA